MALADLRAWLELYWSRVKAKGKLNDVYFYWSFDISAVARCSASKWLVSKAHAVKMQEHGVNITRCHEFREFTLVLTS